MSEEWEEVSRNGADEDSIPACISYKWGEYEVSVRFDKCAYVSRDCGGGDDERDYIHICDFPDFVEMLNKLVKQAEWIW